MTKKCTTKNCWKKLAHAVDRVASIDFEIMGRPPKKGSKCSMSRRSAKTSAETMKKLASSKKAPQTELNKLLNNAYQRTYERLVDFRTCRFSEAGLSNTMAVVKGGKTVQDDIDLFNK